MREVDILMPASGSIGYGSQVVDVETGVPIPEVFHIAIDVPLDEVTAKVFCRGGGLARTVKVRRIMQAETK